MQGTPTGEHVSCFQTPAIKNNDAKSKRTKNAAVDNLVHRPFCKCSSIPVDGFLEVEMLGQRAHASLSTTSFLKLLPLTFPPISLAAPSTTLPMLFFFFWPSHMACGILVPRPGIEPTPPAVEERSLNH